MHFQREIHYQTGEQTLNRQLFQAEVMLTPVIGKKHRKKCRKLSVEGLEMVSWEPKVPPPRLPPPRNKGLIRPY